APRQEMILFEIEDLGREHLRRLATKVAFEYLATARDPSELVSQQFDAVREFVLTGVESEGIVCGVLSDRSHLSGPMDFPVPTHTAFIVGHPLDEVLGGLVTFFGVLYYWVILSRHYVAAESFIGPLLLESPQERRHWFHPFQSASDGGGTRVNWELLIQSYVIDQRTAVDSAKRNAA